MQNRANYFGDVDIVALTNCFSRVFSDLLPEGTAILSPIDNRVENDGLVRDC